jgi:hypothetical protein
MFRIALPIFLWTPLSLFSMLLPRVHTGCPQADSRLHKVALHLVTDLALGDVLEFYGTYIRISYINSTTMLQVSKYRNNHQFAHNIVSSVPRHRTRLIRSTSMQNLCHKHQHATQLAP